MTADRYSPEGLATRCGRLIFALELALEVIDECPVALDSFNDAKVKRVRLVLDEAGIPAVTT
jgi:hypothetical protein